MSNANIYALPWSQILGKPTSFDSTISQIPGLQTALDGKLSNPLPSSGSSIGNFYRVGDTLRFRDSLNTERTLLNGADNLASLTNLATARTNLGAAALTDVTQDITVRKLKFQSKDAPPTLLPLEVNSIDELIFKNEALATQNYVGGQVTSLTSSIAAKEPSITAGTTSQYWRGDKTWQMLNKAAVGLGSVENAAASGLYVALSGAQTVGGAKTFSSTTTYFNNLYLYSNSAGNNNAWSLAADAGTSFVFSSANTGVGFQFDNSGLLVVQKLMVGSAGPKLINSSGTMVVRNTGDSADGPLRASSLAVNASDSFSGSAGTLAWVTPYAGTVSYTSQQSGQYLDFRLITAEGKIAGFQHFDNAHSNGRLLNVYSQPAVAIAFSPSNTELLRLNGFSTSRDATSNANWLITSPVTTIPALRLRPATSQTANVFEVQNNGGTATNASIDASGNIVSGVFNSSAGSITVNGAASSYQGILEYVTGDAIVGTAMRLRSTGVMAVEGATCSWVFNGGNYGAGASFKNRSAWNSSSYDQNPVSLSNTYAQSGTAGSIDLQITRTETSIGSGTHKFIDCYRGSSLFSVDRTGTVLATGNIVSSAQMTCTGGFFGPGIRNTGGASLNLASTTYSAANTFAVISQASFTNSSGTNGFLSVTPTYNQTGTGGSCDIFINRTETALGSGAHYLARLQTASSDQFYVDRAGSGFFAGSVISAVKTRSSNPTTSDLTNRQMQAVYNSTAVETRIWVNDNGTMRSVQLT